MSTQSKRDAAFKRWTESAKLERDEDGTWLLVYADGGTIELESDKTEALGYLVQIGNTWESFFSRRVAEWYLWDNWSECNYI